MMIRGCLPLLVVLILNAGLWGDDSAGSLARSLIAAQTVLEREALLAGHPGIDRAIVARALVAESETLRKSAKYKEAKAGADLALDLAGKSGDQEATGLALFQVGKVFYYQSDYSNALAPLLRSLEIRQKLQDPIALAQTLTLIGNVHRQQGEYSDARSFFNQSLNVSQATGSKEESARALNSLCLVDQEVREYERAGEECAKALSLRREIDDGASIAETLLAEGRLLELQERYDSAIQDYRESLKLYEGLGYPYYVSYLYVCIGNIAFRQDNYVQALEALEKSLKVSESAGDRPNESALRAIGAIHDTQGNYDLALQYLQKALDLYGELKIDPAYAIRVEDAIGNVYLHAGKIPEAREWLERARKAYEERDSPKDLAFSYNELGTLESEQQNYEAASDYFKKGLAAARRGGAQGVEAISLKNLAQIAILQRRYGSALESSQQAASLSIELKQQSTLWQALQFEGQACAAMGEFTRAGRALEQSIALIEDLRGKVAGGEEDRQRFLASRIQPYHAMIDLMLARNDSVAAFAYAERARARVLVEMLHGARTDPTQFMTAPEKSREQDMLGQMSAWNLKVVQENRKAKPDEKQLEAMRSQLQKVRNDHEAFLTNLYAAHPEMRLQSGEIPAISFPEAASLIPDEETAVLEYVMTETGTHLFVFGKSNPQNRPETLSIELSRADLARKIDEFRKKIADMDLDFSGAAEDLYNILLRPAEKLLRGKKNVLIIPDAELWSLPFAALKPGPNRYWLEDHVIVYVPSMAALREMERIRKEQMPDRPQTVFALGNPIASGDTTAPLTRLYRGQTLAPLPDAEREVGSLEKIYGSSRSRIYVGREATEDRFKAEAGRYGLLHIATHGILNDAAPLYSQLVLAPGGASSEDGLLEAWEIMRLKLHADLAVLSACESGRGKIGSGEGVIGLSWALLVAGVPTTVVSQWKVESSSTADLMIQFHRTLASRPAGPFAVAAAMRQAALRFLSRPGYRHPFYWSSFVVIGAGS